MEVTHDELLAKIDEPQLHPNMPRLLDIRFALRAVVELHKPWLGARMNGGGNNGPWCTHCEEVFDGSIRYPCPTIQAIKKELG